MSINASSRTSRVVGLVCLLCVLAVVLQRPTRTLGAQWLRPLAAPRPPPIPDARGHDPRCGILPGAGNVAIAVKTGATEAVEKIPIQMLTSLRCAQNVMIFSDLDQQIAGHQLHDALKDIPISAMEGNSDFDFYWRLRDAKKYGQIERMLKDLRDPRYSTDLAAWTLDKYKQLHILEDLYAAYRDKDWYLMIDADTYLVLPNLLTWIQQLPDPASTELYFGSPAVVGDVSFAHGGSGILMSQATMFDFAVTNKGVASTWDKPMHDECCGDLIIGTVLKQSEIPLKPSWPVINGEKPATLPFGPKLWCEPVVTMHHVEPYEMNRIANLEISRNDSRNPLTFADLFDAFTKNAISDSPLENWDNMSQDIMQDLESYDACRATCQDVAECFQFTYSGKQCSLGYSIHLGGPRPSEEGKRWTSGWLKDRINTWVDNQGPCYPEFPWT